MPPSGQNKTRENSHFWPSKVFERCNHVTKGNPLGFWSTDFFKNLKSKKSVDQHSNYMHIICSSMPSRDYLLRMLYLTENHTPTYFAFIHLKLRVLQHAIGIKKKIVKFNSDGKINSWMFSFICMLLKLNTNLVLGISKKWSFRTKLLM